MRIILALLLTVIAVVLQGCRGDTHCPDPSPPVCPTPPTYYDVTGECNNVNHIRAGSAASPFARYISSLSFTGGPDYVDFFLQPLAKPRHVSLEVFPCHDGTTSNETLLFAVFAKLLQFDMFEIERNSTEEDCCAGCYGISTNTSSDPRATNCSCLNYTKPTVIQNINCVDGSRNGKNKVTHVIDASFMYNPPHYNGALTNGKFTLDPEGILSTSNNQFTDVADNIRRCPLTMTLYHVFVREHNRLVDKLSPCGSNSTAEAKKLMIAIFQRIVYKEFLPLLLGTDAPSYVSYNDTEYPMVSNSFMLAYKLVVASMLKKCNSVQDATLVDTAAEQKALLDEMLSNCSYVIGGKIHCCEDPCAYPDIVSILMQDSRYLGISPYYVYLALTITPISSLPTSFPTLPYQNAPEQVILYGVYGQIYNIDFLSGVFTEAITFPQKFGPTLTKIFKDQFTTLQEHDRFYYEHPDILTTEQLAEVNNITMAHLLCRNVNGLTQVRQNAFDCNSPMINCTELQDIDFCKYCNITDPWGPFETPSMPCVKFQVKIRKCQSPEPVSCPCKGSPFEVAPCPGSTDMLDQNVLLSYQMVSNIMASDAACLKLLRNGNEKGLYNRVLVLLNSNTF